LEKPEWEIAWSDCLSMGVPEMDEEHRQFIARVNELNKAIIECEDKASVGRRMKLMLAQAAQHFAHEEALLDRSGFPQAAAHRARHAELTAQFDRVMKDFEETELSFVWALKGLSLKQRLVEHLLHEDMKYRDFMRAQKGRNQT